MVLVAFLGSRLGSQSRKLLRHKQMPRSAGEGKFGKRAGTTPPLAAAPLVAALVVPPLWLPRVNQSRIEIESVWNIELIQY